MEIFLEETPIRVPGIYQPHHTFRSSLSRAQRTAEQQNSVIEAAAEKLDSVILEVYAAALILADNG